MRKLNILVIVLAFVISTVCCAQGTLGNKICLEPYEMDYFIRQDTLARTLLHDTTNMGIKLRAKDSIIVEKKLNEVDLKAEIITQKTISDKYKDSYNKINDKYDKQVKRTKFFKNVTLIFLSTTLLSTGLLVVLNK